MNRILLIAKNSELSRSPFSDLCAARGVVLPPSRAGLYSGRTPGCVADAIGQVPSVWVDRAGQPLCSIPSGEGAEEDGLHEVAQHPLTDHPRGGESTSVTTLAADWLEPWVWGLVFVGVLAWVLV
jgi:hypothetical protein